MILKDQNNNDLRGEIGVKLLKAMELKMWR